VVQEIRILTQYSQTTETQNQVFCLLLWLSVVQEIRIINRRLGFEFQSFDYWVIILISCTTDNHNNKQNLWLKPSLLFIVVIVCSTGDQNYNPVVKQLKLKTKSSVYCCDCLTINRTLGFEFQLFDYWVIILISCTTDNHNNKQKTWFWVSVVWLLGYPKLKTKSSVYCCDCLWYRRSEL
jgi:hypothetical protein